MDYSKIFKEIVNNRRMVNSYIFYGDQKKSLTYAKFFAKEINGNENNVYLIDKDKLLIDDVENIINSSQSVPFGKHKIFIINNFNNIRNNIDDVLLKTLEDSPKGVIYILVVRNINTLKDTVKSRCQKFYFRTNNKDLSNYLLSYMSQDFFKGFYNVDQLIKDQDIVLILEDFISYLYLDKFDDYRIYNLIREAVKDIKFGLDKQLVVENLVIKLKGLNS